MRKIRRGAGKTSTHNQTPQLIAGMININFKEKPRQKDKTELKQHVKE